MFANYANENLSAKISFTKFEILRLKKGGSSYSRIFFCEMLFFVAFAYILYREIFPLYGTSKICRHPPYTEFCIIFSDHLYTSI